MCIVPTSYRQCLSQTALWITMHCTIHIENIIYRSAESPSLLLYCNCPILPYILLLSISLLYILLPCILLLCSHTTHTTVPHCLNSVIVALSDSDLLHATHALISSPTVTVDIKTRSSQRFPRVIASVPVCTCLYLAVPNCQPLVFLLLLFLLLLQTAP